MKILKCLLMIVTAPAILVLTLFVWLCTGLIYISGLVLGLLSTVIALLGVAVLITYSPQNGVVLLVMAFLISPMGLLEMSRNVQSGNTQNLKSMVIQRSFPKWSVAERRKTAAASDQAAVCACAHSRYFAGGSPSGLRV